MKNFNQMSSKKLNMLLEDPATTPEEVEAINEVLAKRAEVLNGANQKSEGMTAEEQAAIDAAEEAAGNKPAEKQPKVVKPAMTDEEREALAEKLRAGFLYHRCEVVPFNSIEWVPGTVVGILEEKKKNKVMIAIKTEDGRRMVKAHDSQLYKVLEETVTPTHRVSKAPKLDENGNPIAAAAFVPWTPEEMEAELQKYMGNVGKLVSFPLAGNFGKLVEGAEIVNGRIIGLVPEKRNNSVLYRIKPEGEGAKNVHKTAGLNNITIVEEFDEEGAKLNEAYATRHYNKLNGITTSRKAAPAKNPAEALAMIKDSLATAKARLTHFQDKVAKLEAKLPEAEAAYAKYLEEGGTPLASEVAEGAKADNGEDLM